MASPLLTPLHRNRPVGRYAPSPTGQLHLGNLRTALAAWEDCRARNGIFILRVEDIDAPRTVPGAEARMLDDLRWLGLDWDEGPDVAGPAGPYRQSERGDIYQAALAGLAERGLTYLCTCSRKDLREASAPHGEPVGPDGPVYPGTCRDTDPAEQARHPAGAAVRFRIDQTPSIIFTDMFLDAQRFDLQNLSGDFIIRRRAGLWAYQLACAVDDALMGVTHALRGEDLLSSTPRQIVLIRALGWREPTYGHLPLVLDGQGERMCKRDGSCSIQSLRQKGWTREQVLELIRRQPLSNL